MNWKWPYSKKHPNWNPWYTIIRRTIFFPCIVVSLCILVLVVSLSSGIKKAIEVIQKVV